MFELGISPLSLHPPGGERAENKWRKPAATGAPPVVPSNFNQERKKMAPQSFHFNKLELKILDIALTDLKRSRRMKRIFYRNNEDVANKALNEMILSIRTAYGADWIHNHVSPCTSCGGSENAGDKDDQAAQS